MDRIRLDEILQIGAVRCEYLGGKILDTFSVWVKPAVHKKYSLGAITLPELWRAEESDLDFKTALAMFLDWCGEDRRFAEWGRSDIAALAQNAAYWGVELPLPETYLDVQAAFSKTLGIKNSVTLNGAVEYCGIPASFDFHNALHDALYTSLVGGFVTGEALQLSMCALPADMPRQSALENADEWKRTAKPRGRTGPFKTKELALNNRGCRRAACPQCGAAGMVSEWATADGNVYYATFSCAEHGLYIKRLKVSRKANGDFTASAVTLSPTAENKRKLKKAREGERFQCRSANPEKARHLREQWKEWNKKKTHA